MIISICISTYKRPGYLKNLLEKINSLNIPNDCELHVIVVDNDKKRTGEESIKDIEDRFKYKLVYEVEEQKGISYSRNRTVSLVNSNTDFVVFIDDDEYPQEDWLYNLIKTQSETNADLVEGIVFMDFVKQPPKWVIKSDVLIIPHYRELQHGQELPYNAVITNNLLVRYDLLRKLEGPFDIKLALTGGEDTDLGIRLNQIGCKMVFTNKAIVYEIVPKERTTFKWIMQRGYRSANCLWLQNDDKSLKSLLKFLMISISRILIGIICLIPSLILSLFLGFHYFFKVIRIFVRGVAILADILGIHYQEYKHSYTPEVI